MKSFIELQNQIKEEKINQLENLLIAQNQKKDEFCFKLAEVEIRSYETITLDLIIQKHFSVNKDIAGMIIKDIEENYKIEIKEIVRPRDQFGLTFKKVNSVYLTPK
jgi:hypothetical protein